MSRAGGDEEVQNGDMERAESSSETWNNSDWLLCPPVGTSWSGRLQAWNIQEVPGPVPAWSRVGLHRVLCVYVCVCVCVCVCERDQKSSFTDVVHNRMNYKTHCHPEPPSSLCSWFCRAHSIKTFWICTVYVTFLWFSTLKLKGVISFLLAQMFFFKSETIMTD